MRFTPLSVGVATARLASAAVLVLSIVLVAACDTDRTVSPNTDPKPTEVPTAVSAAVAGSGAGNLVLTTVDFNNALIGPAKFKIVFPSRAYSYVTDNDAYDADPTVGKIWLKNYVVGYYNICEIVAPPKHALPDWACHQATVYAGTTTGVEKFVHNRLPWVSGKYTNHLGALVGGGSVTVKDSAGATILVVADNSALDLAKMDGVFSIMLPKAGKFSLCGLNPPAGYALSPEWLPCRTVNAQYNYGHFVDAFVLNPAMSAAWSVRDAWFAFIKPSSFSVTIPGVFLFNVVDNSTNDLDPRDGRLLAKFPAAGPYTLCQTQAPTGFWVAKPACRTVNIQAGASVDAGLFINQEAQVPSQ